MKDMNETKIRIVTLGKKSAAKNNYNDGCHCDDDDNCPECRVQPMTCDCDPQGQYENHKMDQQQTKKHRTFFKISD